MSMLYIHLHLQVGGVRLLRRIARSQALGSVVTEELAPAGVVGEGTGAELEAYVRWVHGADPACPRACIGLPHTALVNRAPPDQAYYTECTHYYSGAVQLVEGEGDRPRSCTLSASALPAC
jgi:hypothetical protein